MSEMAPERQAPRRENVFTRRIGPLPMWVWVVIVGAGIIAYSFYKNRTAGSTGVTGTSAADVPQFVNQTYVTTTAPLAGPPEPPKRNPPVSPPPPHPRSHPLLEPGGPGAFLGGFPGQGPSFRTERLRHKGNLEQIARRNHIDVEDLLEANPELKRYQGTGRQVPVGTTVRIPPAAA